jgi:hypothetical protein
MTSTAWRVLARRQGKPTVSIWREHDKTVWSAFRPARYRTDGRVYIIADHSSDRSDVAANDIGRTEGNGAPAAPGVVTITPIGDLIALEPQQFFFAVGPDLVPRAMWTIEFGTGGITSAGFSS